MKIGILNVTGYTGAEVARLLHHHPQVTLAGITGRSAVGQKIGEVFPHLEAIDMRIQAELDDVDLVISALPSGASAEALAPLASQGIKAIDISPDFRLKNASEYHQWYGTPHAAPHLLEESVYGLVEINRAKIPPARLIANPGCYPTSVILALAPAVKEGIIGPQIIADSKSGVSGAGRTLNLTTHFSEVNENVQAYSLNGHRHLPEMVQELQYLAERPLYLTFVPHLIPVTRGILSTCYGFLNNSWAEKEHRIKELYKDFYSGEPFVKVVDSPPQTKQTWGNNLCLIYPTIDPRTGTLVVISCLDNLVKGAAGQAIQNMNLMLGLPETMGLESLAVYP